MNTPSDIAALLWAGGLAATPVALTVGAVCRWKDLRPATRHLLWLAVLFSFVTPTIGLLAWRPDWSRSDRIIAATDTVINRWRAASGSPAADKFFAPLDAGIGAGCPSNPTSLITGHVLAPTPTLIAAAPVQPAAERVSHVASGATRGPTPDDVGILQAILRPALDVALAQEASMPAPGAAPAPELQADSPAVSCADERVADPGLGASAGLAERVESPASRAIPAVTPLARAWAGVRVCVGATLALRDAIAELPAVPLELWLGGVGLLLGVRAIRTLGALRMMRRARPAPARVCGLVLDAGADIGLKVVPEVLMIEDAVSPMIWCGLRPRLVLPLTLWRSLDAESRRAVIVHELAHLKRRDHILCWIESLIGMAYWWHPVAWWARKRLHDEAEACCDAWVTSLLPESRRAYAAALVATKSFLSEVETNHRPSGAGPWLGVMSGSAKKLARRITMVMTQRTAPRASLVGACVAVLVVAVGTFVTPSIACPPEEGQKHAAAAPAGVTVIKRGEKAAKEKSAKGEADQPGVTFFGEAPALEAMKGGTTVPAVPPGMAVPLMPQGVMVIPAQPPQPGQSAMTPRAGRAPKAPKQPSAFGMPAQPSVDLEALKVGRTARVYHLSEGKREAFWELMSRNDVPVLVQMEGDGIVVYATEEQHPVLDSFVKIIDPDRKVAGMARSPLAIKPRAVAVPRGLGGTAATKESLKKYQQALAELERSRTKMSSDADEARAESERVREQYERIAELTQQLRQSAKDVREDQARTTLDQTVAQLKNRSDALRQQSRSMSERERQLQRQLQEIERRAEELERKVSDLESREPEDTDEAPEISLFNERPMTEIPDVPEIADVVGFMPEPADAATEASAAPIMPGEPTPEPPSPPAPTPPPAP